jgi:hypothetical protein
MSSRGAPKVVDCKRVGLQFGCGTSPPNVAAENNVKVVGGEVPAAKQS